MKRWGLDLGLLLLGAMVPCPAMAYLGFDRVPGDIVFDRDDRTIAILVAYSLCASLGLTLLYYLLKR